MKTYALTDDSVVVVIGSGAGGGTVANELAQQGVDVVCLEAGGRMSFADIENDPPAMDERMGWLDKRIGPGVWLCKTVGGTTVRWSGITPRFLAHEFKARTSYGLNATSTIDWPLTLEELEPYYDRAEDKMGVSGTGDIPLYPETNNYKVLHAGATRVGYKQITTKHVAINPVARDGRPGCQQLGFCHSGCKIGAKWSTLYTEIPKAEATGHFEIRPNSMVLKIDHDKTGKVTGVVYRDRDGVLHEQKARAVCVAGNVVETTRLLLSSKSGLFPEGLANGSGHVGRNHMRHVMGFVYAVMPGPVNAHRASRQNGMVLDELDHREERGFAGGYIMETAAGAPDALMGTMSTWGRSATAFTDRYDHVAGLFVTGEDPAEASNRITLHPTEKDEAGLPVPVLEYADHPNSVAMRKHAMSAGAAIYESLGATHLYMSTELTGECHNMGVARMSENPRDGVTNKWGQAHDVPNLFISDGSVFSSSAAANPTLTITALAIRQAEHIAERMRRREL
ncbi:MAG: GMC family oxidoreductase [Gammaproteobacteria bacterium]|nr:GMC family oxidoreductase [Gammaproteobacteria bacterium]